MKKISFLFVLLFIFSIIALINGKFDLSLNELFGAIFSDEKPASWIVMFEIRLPRVLGALLIGASLGVAGACYQNLFINPLVSPSILGVLSGASFGAALAMVLGFSVEVQMFFTFVFGFLAVLVALIIAFFGGANVIMLVLGGVISTSLFGSLLAILKYAADPNETLLAITYFLMGSLSFATKSVLLSVSVPMIFGILGLLLMSKFIDVLSMGEEEAKALGVNVAMIKICVIFLATLISALSVMLAGIIGWIGLIVPHIARFVFGASAKIVLFSSSLIGAVFLLICDIFNRSLFSYEVPIGIISSLFGIPIFIAVLLSRKNA
ncbi:ABC transporter, permease protein [Campylobacter iguaniorum]|uniref:FecCD family ABC transporter permease n=1 Tax=Campylobacter iguaniorum TaxID=1244531 RepID=UPI0007C95B25|nr:iron ABC transporter permease [Campylobacter iguaniorum]ANE35327.1 ABC transporter, permease protein [Campylobacter iguaniorum]